jgi:hypothetical protein
MSKPYACAMTSDPEKFWALGRICPTVIHWGDGPDAPPGQVQLPTGDGVDLSIGVLPPGTSPAEAIKLTRGLTTGHGSFGDVPGDGTLWVRAMERRKNQAPAAAPARTPSRDTLSSRLIY